MAKYIDVEKVFCADCEDRDKCGSPDIFCDVHSMPAADVAPVVHGEWVEHIDPLPWCEDDVDVFWKCSVCEAPNFAIPPYCPNCGAKMDGERKGDDAAD